MKSRRLAWLICLGNDGKIKLPSSNIMESCPVWSAVWALAGVVSAGVCWPAWSVPPLNRQVLSPHDLPGRQHLLSPPLLPRRHQLPSRPLLPAPHLLPSRRHLPGQLVLMSLHLSQQSLLGPSHLPSRHLAQDKVVTGWLWLSSSHVLQEWL